MPSVKPKKKKLKKEINEVEEPQGNYTYNDLNKIADDLSNTSDIVSCTVHFYVSAAGQIHSYEGSLSVVHWCSICLCRYPVV